MQVHYRVTPSLPFIHLGEERPGILRIKHLAQEHNAMNQQSVLESRLLDSKSIAPPQL